MASPGLDFSEGANPYQVLGLEKGPESTADDIKKAYRKLALTKHPDKNKAPNAAAEFMELQKAHAILTDKHTRGALDDYLRAKEKREARYSAQSAKRQKQRQDLDAREKDYVAKRSEEQVASERLKAELEALRQRMAAEQRQKQEAEAAAAAARRAAFGATGVASTSAHGPDGDSDGFWSRTVKVSWDPTLGCYTSDRIRDALAAHGPVEDVIIKEQKKKNKGSAFVVMSSDEAAGAVCAAVCGDLDNPLLVVPWLKEAAAGGQQQKQQPQRQPSPMPTTGGGLPSTSSPAVSRQTARPSKPLFPGATARAGSAIRPMPGASSFGSFPAATTSFPGAGSSFGSFPPAAGGNPSTTGSLPSSFSSFPGATAPAANGTNGAGNGPSAGSYEGSVLEKMKQRAAERQKAQAPKDSPLKG